MRTAWREGAQDKQVVSPVSLVISAFSPVSDIRRTLTPVLRPDLNTQLILIDLGGGKNRMGGSILHQAYLLEHGDVPDLDSAKILQAFFKAIQDLNKRNKILAYHDRSDGGLIVTLAECMFASHVGLTIDLEVGSDHNRQFAALFSEELGAVIQIDNSAELEVHSILESYGLADYARKIGHINDKGTLEISSNGSPLMDESGWLLQRTWSKTTFQMQSMRDNPECAKQEYDRMLDTADPGLNAHLTFNINDSYRFAVINKGAKPKIAVLREQGVNGQIEMAAAFDRAGFSAIDVHMSDIISGRTSLAEFKGLAACGGFSYGDVLGAGEGWAKSILFNARALDEFSEFFNREDSFALGVCNGCQMMSNLREIIPGAEHWPRFVKNKSEQFEARFVMTEITPSPSILFRDMVGSRMPVVTSHGEGLVEFESEQQNIQARSYVSMRYVDNYGEVAEQYPFNPNGSAGGETGFTSRDGRFTIMMPHPERVFRATQNSWHPEDWNEDGAWMFMFRNARYWVS
jgi:phosphoribosylformylglycinamidine synthase